MSITKKIRDAEEIERALAAVLGPGQVSELRALNVVTPAYRKPHTLSGYFNDRAKMAAAAASISDAMGIYILLNVPVPAILARAANRLREAKAGESTSDNHIIRRRWIPVDVDPSRISGVSATDAEHEDALELGLKIRDKLTARGWPEPIFIDSANGGLLLYRIDLPADDGGLCEKCLAALAQAHDTSAAHVDKTMFNAARIVRLAGTWNCKGDNTPDRPHRMARLLSVPEKVEIVPIELLEALAARAVDEKPASARPGSTNKSNGKFSIDDFMQRHFPEAKDQSYKGGRKWQIDCPFDPSHAAPDACIYEAAGGELAFRCSHNSCSGRTWRDLRAKLEPENQNFFDAKAKWERSQHREDAEGKRDPVEGNGRANRAGDSPRIIAPVLVCMADVQPVPVQWLWPNRIPLARATVLCGKPGEGKSFAALDIAARVTTGGPWPDGSGNAPMGNVLVVMPEDNDEDTTRVRLDAMHADVSKVQHLAGVRHIVDEADPQIAVFTLADISAFRQAVQIVQPKLVIIDPIGSAIGGKVDAHRDNEVRASLAPALALAAEYKFALLLIAHRRKSAGESADDVVLGSRAFTGLARVVLHLSHDKVNENRRLLLPGKNNLASKQDGLAFSIEGDPPTIVWERDGVKMSADEGIAAEHDDGQDNERTDAMEFLRGELADLQEHLVEDIKKAANDAGLHWRTVQRAATKLKVKRHRQGFGGRWVWRLPKTAENEARAIRATTVPTEKIGTNGTYDVSTVQSTNNITPSIPYVPPDLLGTNGHEITPPATDEDEAFAAAEREAIQWADRGGG